LARRPERLLSKIPGRKSRVSSVCVEHLGSSLKMPKCLVVLRHDNDDDEDEDGKDDDAHCIAH